MLHRWAIGRIISGAARQKVSETVADAVRQAAVEAQSAAADDLRAADLACDVAVIMALGIEAGPLVDRMRGVVKTQGEGFTAHVGKLAEQQVIVAVSGPGGAAARRAIGAVHRGHAPDWIVSAGLAGGLNETVKRGDMVIPNRLLATDGSSLTVDFRLEPMPHQHVGPLLTVDKVVRTSEEKHRLGQQFAALAVDMETRAVAEFCREHKQRFLAVRVVGDEVNDRLPDDIEHLMRQKTLAGRAGAVAGAVFRRPSSVKDMWRLKTDALSAADRLADYLCQLLPQLR